MTQGATESVLGRDNELALVAGLIQGIAAAGRVVVVEGPPGIGKTRLLHAAMLLARQGGLEVFLGRGSLIESDFGFGIVRQLFEAPVRRRSAGERRRLFDGAAELAETVLATRPDASPSTLFQSLHGLYWLCVNLADQGPILIAVDDAQWADEASMQWLAFLANRLDDVPVLVLVTRRPAEVNIQTPTLDSLARDRNTTVIELKPLDRPTSAELLTGVIGSTPTYEFVDACYERAGGNPFLLRELSTAVVAAGIDPASKDAAAHVPTVRPDTVGRSVQARLAALPPDCTTLAQAVAVLEANVHLREAADLAGLELRGATMVADRLASAQILRAAEPLEFLHPLLRDAVYEDLAAGYRGSLHRRAATLLADSGAPPDRVAGHLLLSPKTADPWVVVQLRRAAQAALARGAVAPAIAFLERAMTEPPPIVERAQVLRELGEAQARAAPAPAAERLRQALALTSDPRERLEISGALANAMMVAGAVEPAAAALEDAIADLPADFDADERLRAEAALLSLGLLAPKLFRRTAQRISNLPPLAGVTAAERLVLASVVRCHSLLDVPWQDVVALAVSVLEKGQLRRDQRPDSGATPTTALPLLVEGRFDLLDEVIESLFEDGRRLGSAVSVAIATHSTATRHSSSGDLRLAETAARRALELAPEAWPLGIPLIVARLIKILVERGHLDEAEDVLETYGLDGLIPDTAFFFGNALMARGQLRLAQHRTREALDDLMELGRREREGGYHEESWTWQALAATAMARMGDSAAAITLATNEVERARRRGVVLNEAIALRALGLILEGDAGIQTLRESADLLAPRPFRLEYALSLTALGAALRRANRRAEAREPLREALDLAQRLGADNTAATTRAELEATGARPRSALLSGVAALTASERRVAELAARGNTNAQIAQALFVTRKTVEVHLGNAYRKLSISGRAQLAAALNA